MPEGAGFAANPPLIDQPMIEPDQIKTFVRSIHLFSELSEEHVDQVVESLSSRSYKKGEKLLSEGEEPSLCVVVSGQFRTCQRQEDLDLDVEVMRYRSGQSFGEVESIVKRKSFAYAEAVTDGWLLHLGRAGFDRLMNESPRFASKVCKSLAGRLAEVVERVHAVPTARLTSETNLTSHASLLSPRVCRACKCLVLDRMGDRVRVGMVDPSDTNARSFIGHALNPLAVEWATISQSDFDHHIERIARQSDTEEATAAETAPLRYRTPGGVQGELASAGESRLLAKLLSTAIRRGASDLHLEPGRDSCQARMRVDGQMMVVEDEIASSEFRQMVVQSKVMCELDIARNQLPMDGSFALLQDDKAIDVRVSTMPCQGGEKAVLRLIAPQPYFSRLENLIVAPALAGAVRDMVASQNGLVLVTGPTGSGKTTTLYAALQTLWRENPTINVVTIEDPIEYNLPFATQVQINPATGFTFATALRSVLRQDPDVLLVGEIRDAESAMLAVNAAATGHLVLSSLHTHSSLETLTRLRNLGIESYMLSDALKGVVSQKLVPRLPPGGGITVPYDDPMIDKLKRLSILPEDFSGQLRRAASGDHEANGESFHFEQGRVGVYEVLSVTERIRQFIEMGATHTDVERTLEPGELTTFADYSRLLLSKGIVAPERIERLFRRVDLEGVANIHHDQPVLTQA